MKKSIILITVTLFFIACGNQKVKEQQTKAKMIEVTLKVEGMTCDHCEMSICKGVKQLAGIDSVSANFEDSTTFIRFNTEETNLDQIAHAISERGYLVVQED